jgi:methylated-DNA-[protein]-cysteine S-methyltransferase
MIEKNISVINSPLGSIIIEGTMEAISRIEFAIPQAEKIHASDLHNNCIKQLNEYFEGTRKDFSFPIDQEGTPFQQEVWKALLTIPYGQTLSYIQLAKQLGDEKAVRVVGGANGKNKIAIVVPCHRVIGNNNTLTGYAGGLEKKKWLLQHEHNFSPVKEGFLF